MDDGAVASSPTFSACVIAYNQERFIGHCLESILRQKGDFTMEVVVSDDCSTDRTRDIVERYAAGDSRIRVLDAHENLGMGGNLKRAFRACRGQFIALCEGDDFWTDDLKLARQLGAFQKNSDVTLCATGGVQADDFGHYVGAFPQFHSLGYVSAADVLRGGGGRWPTCSTAFRRECISRVPFWVFEHEIIDWPLWVFLARQGRVWYDPIRTCAWRVATAGSWTASLLKPDRFLQHHLDGRRLEALFERELGASYRKSIRSGFQNEILYFYATRRLPLRRKLPQLLVDLKRLSTSRKIIALAFALIPGLGEFALAARRKLLSARVGRVPPDA